jgi:hypothetical protein
LSTTNGTAGSVVAVVVERATSINLRKRLDKDAHSRWLQDATVENGERVVVHLTGKSRGASRDGHITVCSVAPSYVRAVADNATTG